MTSSDRIATVDGPRDQAVIPGAERSAHQAQQARDAIAGGKIRRGQNRPLDSGLFGPKPEPQLFDKE